MRKLVLPCIVIIAILLFWFFTGTSGEYYRTYSPDKQYSVYVSKYNSDIFTATMPGNSGGIRGKLFLYDEIEKKVIATGKIEMQSYTTEIKWRENSAYYLGDNNIPNSLNPWILPRKIKLSESFIDVNTKVSKNDSEIIREYYPNTNKLKTEYKQGSFMSCGIIVEYIKEYYQNGSIKKESKIDNHASKQEHSGCHDIWTLEKFTEYFENGNLKTKGFKKYGYQSSECPCGSWQSYNKLGELIDTKSFGDCFDEKFDCE